MNGFVSIRNLRKSYGAFEALKGIDLDIMKGEVICVIGPSGSGKSTLIRCINRLEDFSDASEIRVDGTPVRAEQSLAKVRAELGMVFQNFNLFSHLSVFSLYKCYGPHTALMYGKYELLVELDNQYHYFYGKMAVFAFPWFTTTRLIRSIT